ncbi:MAG: DinB family protein [Chitinophagaceae bacterium]
MPKPKSNEYPEYFGNYINQVTEENLNEAFANQSTSGKSFLENIPSEKWDYAYAEGKWTVKELVQHLIDTERIFAYRALCFARGEKTSLPSFEEDDYAIKSYANKRTPSELIQEYHSVRNSIELLFNSFTDDMLQEIGVANNKPTSVLSIGFIMVGHFNHHKRILEQRYFNG